MRADRLLSIVLLLQVNRRLTAYELAQRLEVSERTIYRDMDALSTAGIPVVAERGNGGGWSLINGYKTSLTGLNEAEIQTLFLSKPARLLADLGLHQAAETALNKLLAALPTMYQRNAEYIRQRIHIDATGWHHSEENVSFLPTLQEAIWQELKVKVTYQLSTGPIVKPRLDPLGLVAKGNVWYLVALFKDQVCVYRVSRVQAATISDQPSLRPANFNLADFWAESSANFVANLPRYLVTVRVDPAILPELRCAGRFPQLAPMGPVDAEGWQKVALQFETEREAGQYILGFGSQIEVIEPQTLQTRVLEGAKRIVTLYTQKRDLVTKPQYLEVINSIP